MALVLTLFHGRRNPAEELDDWGFEGPQFRCAGLHVTYLTNFRIAFATAEQFELAKRLTGWPEWDALTLSVVLDQDMVKALGNPDDPTGFAWYGDWSLIDESEIDEASLNRLKAAEASAAGLLTI